MENAVIKKKVSRMLSRSRICLFGTYDGLFPNIKAMLKTANDDFSAVYFSTNKSSHRVQQVLKNPYTCIYMYRLIPFRGCDAFWKIRSAD